MCTSRRSPTSSETQMARPRNVLLVTKPGLTCNVTSACLTMYGYEVLAADGAEAEESLRSNQHIDVVVIDLDLVNDEHAFAIARVGRGVKSTMDVVYTSRMPRGRWRQERSDTSGPLPSAPARRRHLPSVGPVCGGDGRSRCLVARLLAGSERQSRRGSGPLRSSLANNLHEPAQEPLHDAEGAINFLVSWCGR